MKKSELYSMLWEACNKLRGGVEPARYKDYVLVLLFFKYVSDRYKGQRRAEFTVSPGASFDDLIEAKGSSDVGERVDKIIQKFLEENKLAGALPDVSFNNPDELGTGKELVDKVSGLIGVFQNPSIDFKSNRASGDDIIGDAYEYFMMKFAQASGKSKGQFYTPSEVSRIIARLIGIGEIEPSLTKKWTLYDPAAGSGSLLIRAADEAPVDERGNSIVTIYGQEKDTATAGLAKMNLILHQKGTGEIKKGNTLQNPAFLDDFNELRKFDFVVMNPPFSDKSWTDGIDVAHDKYHRFDGYGIPSATKGDFAWFLHVLKSLGTNGKAGIVMPHGILYRGNAEKDIRIEVLKKHYIKGVISLPNNLFYGTNIAACIVIIDKENADERDGVFIINASQGFKKDGNQNRLREQDIEKIVQTFTNMEEIAGYSRFVSYEDILEKNDGDLNVNRYVPLIDNVLPQNIAAHLHGGIPERDIDSLVHLWTISPSLKKKIFRCTDNRHNIYHLGVSSENIEDIIHSDDDIQKEVARETNEMFSAWKKTVREPLLTIDTNTNPRLFIRSISFELLKAYKSAQLLDAYDVYDCLLNYWLAKLQDDVYAIKNGGYEIAREIDYEYVAKKTKKEVKSFDGVIIPKLIIENEYFANELEQIQKALDSAEEMETKMVEMLEEESGEDGLLFNVLNEKGDNIPKANINKRMKEISNQAIENIVYDEEYKALIAYKDLLDKKGEADKKVKELRKKPEAISLKKYYEQASRKVKAKMVKMLEGEAREDGLLYKALNEKGNNITQTSLDKRMKEISKQAILNSVYNDEYKALLAYKDLMDKKCETDKKAKELRKKLDAVVQKKYSKLTVEEIKELLFEKKWMAKLSIDIVDEADKTLNALSTRVLQISRRYEHTLEEIENKALNSRSDVIAALERMGYKW